MLIFAHSPLQSLQEAWLIGIENAGLVCEENQWCQGQEAFLLLLLVLEWWPRVNIKKLLGRRPRNNVSNLGMLWMDGAIQRDLAGGWYKTAEVPVGPKNCSQEGNSGQLPGVPIGRGQPQQGRWPTIKNVIRGWDSLLDWTHGSTPEATAIAQ